MIGANFLDVDGESKSELGNYVANVRNIHLTEIKIDEIFLRVGLERAGSVWTVLRD